MSPSKSRTLFSLSGVVPLGAFLLEHLVVNATALGGQASFAAATRALRAVPGVFFLEVLFVYAPLALHAGYGLVLLARRERLERPYPPALGAALRATGVLALAFIALHVVEVRLGAGAVGARREIVFAHLAAQLSSTRWTIPWRALFYVVGLAATVFHFAVGLWGWLASRGTLASERARRRGGWAALVAGALVFFAGFDAVVYLATGSAIVGRAQGAESADPSRAPCPAP